MPETSGSPRLPALLIFGAIFVIALVGVGLVLVAYEAPESEHPERQLIDDR